MRHLLQRHPFPVEAFFRRSLVLTYAFPVDLLRPLLPPGLSLDTYGDLGFLTIAMVSTERLRPVFLPPALGRDCFLVGFRLFVRRERSLRGLYILQSYTEQPWMVCAGNILTHYRYRLCDAVFHPPGTWILHTPGSAADLEVKSLGAGRLPAGSPFPDAMTARRFAGPLPYTFDYEPQTHSIIQIRGVRAEWNPQPVEVEVRRNTFLERPPFCRATPILANAFEIRDLPYRWERGRRTVLEAK